MATSQAYADYLPQILTDIDDSAEPLYRLENTLSRGRSRIPTITLKDLEPFEFEEEFESPTIVVLEEKQNKALQLEALMRAQSRAEFEELYAKLSPTLYATITLLSSIFFVVCLLEGLYLYSLPLGFLVFGFGALAYSKAYIRKHIKRSWRQIREEG